MNTELTTENMTDEQWSMFDELTSDGFNDEQALIYVEAMDNE